jgi:hypothetical protein
MKLDEINIEIYFDVIAYGELINLIENTEPMLEDLSDY